MEGNRIAAMIYRPIAKDYVPIRRYQDTLIRFFDIVFSLVALFVLCPLLCLIAVLIRLDSAGPVLFRQDRVGLNGNIFKIYKFRSMRPRKVPSKPQYKKNAQGRLEPVIKVRDNSRVTRVGYILRKYSLDELPQFINVLKGEMSLVGTRPPVPEEVDGYDSNQWDRLRGKPGLTGLAQINGRSDMEFDRIVQFDIYYIQHRTLWLYLKILLQTVPFFLSGKGSF